MAAKVGDPAPDFELAGSGERIYRLTDYEGTGVVLAFYPGDFTAVCTKQFCSYRDAGDQVESLGMPMLGVSPQSVDSHERFINELSLNVPLLADEDKAVSRAYGVVGLVGIVRRALIVVDGELVVRHRDVKRLGASYETIDDIERAVAAIR